MKIGLHELFLGSLCQCSIGCGKLRGADIEINLIKVAVRPENDIHIIETSDLVGSVN